jgi:hypothetical protein
LVCKSLLKPVFSVGKATTLVETFACMAGDKGAGFKSAMSIMAASKRGSGDRIYENSTHTH